MLSNKGRFRDRNPGVVPAGKLFDRGDAAKECMKNPRRPKTPEEIFKFKCSTQPAPGKKRIFYGHHGDPDIASHISHGINTKPSFIAGEMVNPKPQSYFKFRLNEKREDGVYASHQRAPLGRSHDQRKGLPAGMDLDENFGLPTIKDCSAGELVSPAKSYKQVKLESKEGLELYKKSHSAYTVGESYDRQYDWKRIPKTSCFGIDTPHDNRGLNTKKTLKWLQETRSEKSSHITSKQVDDFRERQIPKVGRVHDPIKDTMNVNSDHVFGIIAQPDEYGAGDLINMRNEKTFSLRGKEREHGFLAAIRQHMKKANYHNFTDLKSAFEFYDKDKSGTIDIGELKQVCQELKLPVNRVVLERLLALCDTNTDQQIDYMEFVNFLNWKDQMPTGLPHGDQATDYDRKIMESIRSTDENQVGDDGSIDPGVLQHQTDIANYFQTSSSLYGKGNLDKYGRPYGIPTIRSDIPAPRIRRIGDNTNYGDESDAHGLMNPSIYSNNGVYEEDFFKGRQPHEVRRICDSIGVEMTNEMFQEIWEQAQNVAPNGEVSVESFRHVLDEQVADKFQKMALEDRSNTFQDTLRKATNTKPAIYKTILPKCKELITA
uniref:EF-hand domain-containing protein n=1 Tax=Clytia hemisphaerica TaxID=252671 RepID=A0A069DUR3_9CNID